MAKGVCGQLQRLAATTTSSDFESIASTPAKTDTPINNTTVPKTPLNNTTTTPSLAPDDTGAVLPPILKKAAKAATWFLDLLQQWGIPEWAARIALTIVVLLLTWYASNLITQLLGRRITRRFQRPSVSRTILRVTRGSVIALGVFFVVANIYGVPISNLALSLTVLSATVGVVLAPLVGNIISGLFVLADQPYEVGDMIEIVDTEQQGFVEDITISHTKLFTTDNTLLVIPNGSMRERDVINYTGEDLRTRLHLDIGVTYESDINEARELIEDAAREVDIVIDGGPDIRIGSARYPAQPTCYIDQFEGSNVQLRLRYWIKETTQYSLLSIRSRIQENVWEQLEDADVSLAYPHSHIVFDDTSGELNVSMRQQTATNSEQPAQSSDERPARPTGSQPRIDD